jgi:zinc protease
VALGVVEELGLGQDPDQYELNGIPLFHLPLPGSSTIVTLSFGTGRADEPMHRGGISHLAEHLVMDGVGDLALDGNGTTEPFRVYFSLLGTPDDAAGFLRDVGRSISEPLLERVNAEVSVLRTEDDGRGGAGQAVHAAYTRYGHAGLGQCGTPELFLRDPDPGVLKAWMAEHLVGPNAAVWVAGVLPDDLELALPDGRPHVRERTAPILGFEAPCMTVQDVPGVTASFVVERTAAVGMALHVAERRLRRALRIDRSLGYLVGLDYTPMDASIAHAVLTATCQPDRAAEVEGVLITVLDDLANRGATADEIRQQYERFRRLSAEQFTVPGRLDATVRDLHFGESPTPVADLDAEYAAVDEGAIRSAMKGVLSSMLLIVPSTGFVPNRTLRPYPGPSTVEPVALARFRLATPERKPWQPKPSGPTLVVGRAAVAIEDEHGRTLTSVPWSDCVAYVVDPHGRMLYGRDGYRLVVAAQEWERSAQALTWMDQCAPAEVTVRPR